MYNATLILLVFGFFWIANCNPMLCQSSSGRIGYHLPPSINCPLLDDSLVENGRPTILQLYKENIKTYEIDAHVCTKKGTRMWSYVNFWSKPYHDSSTESLRVTRRECMEMRDSLACSVGEMTKTPQGGAKTDNNVDWWYEFCCYYCRNSK